MARFANLVASHRQNIGSACEFVHADGRHAEAAAPTRSALVVATTMRAVP